jgi:hypothetical protein
MIQDELYTKWVIFLMAQKQGPPRIMQKQFSAGASMGRAIPVASDIKIYCSCALFDTTPQALWAMA